MTDTASVSFFRELGEPRAPNSFHVRSCSTPDGSAQVTSPATCSSSADENNSILPQAFLSGESTRCPDSLIEPSVTPAYPTELCIPINRPLSMISLPPLSQTASSKSDPGSCSTPRSSTKESVRVVVGAIDAQINSLNEMLCYFSKLIKAEKAVQQAFFELIPGQKILSSRVNGVAGFPRFLSTNARRQMSSGGSSSTDMELTKILQGLVNSTSQQARSFSTRALFHKVITMAQLESLITCHQCLKRTYVECETELQTQSDQYTTNLKTTEKKYARYVEQLNGFRTKLSGLCDKRTSFNRKTIENLMHSLDTVTKKLHLLHNDYVLALLTANHFQHWLHTRLRPCLLNGIERTMQLTCEVVHHLLVFGGETVGLDRSSPAWLEELQTDRNLNNLLEQHNIRFPGPVSHTFKLELLRVPVGTLLPDSLVYGDTTRPSFAYLIQAYRSREMFYRETVDQLTRDCIQWEEALAQWRAVFSRPLPNPWVNTFSPHDTMNLTASAIANSIENGFPTSVDSWFNQCGVPDIQDLWQDDRARPVNLCEISYRLTVCEFELCFASCLAEAHSHIVTQLLNTQQHAQVNSVSADLSPIFLAQSNNCRLTADLPDLLEQPRRLNVPPSFCERLAPSQSLESPLSLSSSPPITSSHTASTHTSRTSLTSSELGKNRLWRSFRVSVSRWRSNFTRSGRLRSSLGHAPDNSMNSSINADPVPTMVVIDRQSGLRNIPSELNRVILIDDSSRANNLGLPPLHSPSSASHGAVALSSPNTPVPPDDHTLQRSSADSSIRDHGITIVREADINKEPWFHGVLPRTEVERLLQNQGDFLVRQTNKRSSCRDPISNWPSDANDPTLPGSSSVLRMVLSVYWNGAHKHFILCGGTPSDKGWFLEDGEFPTIRELLEHHMMKQTPVTAKSGACLITPILRPDWELDNKDVQLVQKIGQGNFGEVYRGVYNGCEVAVKTCRVDMGASGFRQKFLQGERTALNFCHPHIVKLIGIAVRSYPIMIVMEYVPGGSLLAFLRKSRDSISLCTMLLMASDAASGMAYLESKNCIHRDLAARNCLVTEAGRLKIADFGMSREEHIYELSDRHGQIPIKWTAPEALATGRYTIKCDVWSYGVLLWEIFTFGDVPYRFWSNPQTREMVESGYRLPPPDNMPPLIRTQMNNCWLADPDKRPSFAELSQLLEYPTTKPEAANWNPIKMITSNDIRRSTLVRESSASIHKFSRLSLTVKDKRNREI